MKKHISISSKRSCTGCGACVNVCPKNAISISLNKEGFYEASVNEDKCVNCGICQTICYKFISAEINTVCMSQCKVAGAHSSNEQTQYTTTSGGIAHEISLWGLRNGYKILGVIYDYDTNKSKSILIDNYNDLELLKGSKYLQSDISCFKEFFKEAQNNPLNKYICIGTPCQIFGIKQTIQQKRLENEFILIDLFCHGVPSYLVWIPYIRKIIQKTGIPKNINFRYKGNGWHQYTMRIEGEKGIYSKMAYNDLFYRFFFDNIALNRPCFSCEVRKTYIAADLRLGDFWGKCYEHREDGVSAVLIATKKGKNLLNILVREKRIIIDRYWDNKKCLQSQSTENYPNIDLRDSVIEHLIKNKELNDTLNWYFKKLPIKSRIRSILKQVSTSLPNSYLIKLRRFIRK